MIAIQRVDYICDECKKSVSVTIREGEICGHNPVDIRDELIRLTPKGWIYRFKGVPLSPKDEILCKDCKKEVLKKIGISEG